jgi:hypothetical protein
MPELVALTVADDAEAWRRAGFTVDDSGTCRIGSVDVRIRPVPEEGSRGLRWTLELDGPTDSIDGIATEVGTVGDAAPAEHANGAVAFDHVVVMTPDLDRTVAALQSHGFEVTGTREGEAYGKPMRQAFFRLGDIVLDVAGPPAPDGDGPAQVFGVAVTVADLAAAGSLLGENLGEPKDATQPGRQVASVRSKAGLKTPVAFMSPG